MTEKITRIIKDKKINVFRTVLYYDGVTEDEILIPAAPCQNCYSLSKSITSIAVGIAQDMGKLDIKDQMIGYFRNELPHNYDTRLNYVTIEHLLTMTMGISKGYLFESDRYGYKEQNWVRLILSGTLEYEPGVKFTYSNSNYYLLSCLVHRACGMTMQEFLRIYLFDRMNIKSYAWETCPRGEAMGATGLYMSTPDIAEIGIMLLNGGLYRGQRIISCDYLTEAAANHVNAGNENYGYGFWINKYGFNGSGAYGQTLFVMPEKKLVFAAHAFEDNADYLGIVESALNF